MNVFSESLRSSGLGQNKYGSSESLRSSGLGQNKYGNYHSLKDLITDGEINDIKLYLHSMDQSLNKNDDNPLFYALNAYRDDVITMLIDHKIHTMCDNDSLYILSVCYNQMNLTEYALSMGANINFIPSSDFLYRYDGNRYASYRCFHNFDDNNEDDNIEEDLSDYILYNITWEITRNPHSNYLNYLKYLIDNGINLFVKNCEYLKYELYNSDNSRVLSLIMEHIVIPDIILEKFFKLTLMFGHQKYYDKIKNFVNLRYDLIEEVTMMWKNDYNKNTYFSDIIVHRFNKKINFYIDNIYHQCGYSVDDTINDIITNILNLCIKENKALLSYKVFEKLALLEFDLIPYINDILIISLYEDNIEIIKFLKNYYDIPDILESLNTKIMKI